MNVNLKIKRIQDGIDKAIENGNSRIRKVLKRFSKIRDISGAGFILAVLINPSMTIVGIIEGRVV
ncbi:hypothetical protein A7H1H_1374 [Aliarcobacter butzleri 7h1h]|uniref:hypothetical protein n=1 Tax=Aliarcobacter butzleri TaxID=28197 RepID=UPI0002FFE558|nr:hypothetical protein [Aliarcobacter butzleri]AGR77661.1 hypothetical protein A7H1H_1374 [Aliarcobacter butzleri 7h1h]MCG3665174.1 hypothetical protein [Aliarcobacter butzleri]